jgi:hypothetical protein
MSKVIVQRESYPSKSNPDKTYEALRYEDGTLSCNCNGWTRHVRPDGTRSCWHVEDLGQRQAPVTVGPRYFNEVVNVPAQMVAISGEKVIACIEAQLLTGLKVHRSERMVIERIEQWLDEDTQNLKSRVLGRVEPKTIIQRDACSGCPALLPDEPASKGWLFLQATGWICPRHLENGKTPPTGFLNVRRGSKLDVADIAAKIRGGPDKPQVVNKGVVQTVRKGVPAGARRVGRRFYFEGED